MSSNFDRVKAIETEAEGLGRFLEGLRPEDLERRSACEAWTVGEVVAHLVERIAEPYMDAISRGIKGDLSPTKGFPEMNTVDQAWLSEFNIQRAIDHCAALGDGLITAFRSRYAEFCELLRSLEPDDWDKPCYGSRVSRSVERFIPITMQELALHGWDIRSRFGSSARLSRESLPLLIDVIPNMLRHVLATEFPRDSKMAPVTLRFEFVDQPAATDFTIEEGRCRMAPREVGRKADVTLTMDADTYVLLMYRRISLEEAIKLGKLQPQGDSSLIPAFDGWLQRG